MTHPDLTRIPEWYHGYIRQVETADLKEVLKKQHISFAGFLKTIPPEKRDYRYADGKWSIREVIQHILDAERVFAYRALCIARGEKQPLPSFDENDYAAQSDASDRSWESLEEEFKAIRLSTEILFNSFNEEKLEKTGIASGWPVYVRGIGFIIAGHLQHHWTILKEKYLG